MPYAIDKPVIEEARRKVQSELRFVYRNHVYRPPITPRDLETRLIHTETDAVGGYGVPSPFRRAVDMEVKQSNLLLRYCTWDTGNRGLIADNGNTLVVPATKTMPDATAVAEAVGTLPVTDPEFEQTIITAHKVKQSVVASREWLEDTADKNVVARWLGRSIGGGQMSLVTADIIAGCSGALSGAVTDDNILGMMEELAPDYWMGSPAWMAHPTTIRLMRTAMAGYTNSWEPSIGRGYPLLEGFPIVPNVHSPTTGAGTILFGDFSYIHVYFPDARVAQARGDTASQLSDPEVLEEPELAQITVARETKAELGQVVIYAFGRCGAAVSVDDAVKEFTGS